MRKPAWLKKADASKPWKYKLKTSSGLVIEPYNFTTHIGDDLVEIEKACDWIDSQMSKKRVRAKVKS